MAKNEVDSLAAGYAAAIVSAVIMLLLGILGNLGFYLEGVEAMAKWHLFFSLSIGGILAGMLEAAVVSFVLVYVFVLVYQKLAK